MRLTIRQFQDITKVSETDLDEVDKSILIVKIVTGYGDKEIDKMSTKKFNRMCRVISKHISGYVDNVNKEKPKKYINVNGKTYQLHYDITRITAGKYVEAVTFKDDMIGNLHKMLATMAVPMKWTWKGLKAVPFDAQDHSKIAEEMLDADFSIAYQACVFFWAVLVESIRSLNIYGNNPEMQTLAILEKHLLRTLDGYTMPNWYQNLKPSN